MGRHGDSGLVLVVACGAVFLAFEVGFVGFHVGGDVMRLKVVFIFHDKHVVVRHQVIGLIRNRIIQLVIKVIVAGVILLCRLQDVLDLSLKLLLLLQLLLTINFVHYLLITNKLLPLILLSDCLIDHFTFLLKRADPAEEIIKLEVRSSDGTLVVEAAILIVFIGSFFTIQVAVI